MAFWDNFVNCCKLYGESPSGAAKAVGISRSTVSSWRKGDTNPSFVAKALLTRHFNLPMEFDWDSDLADIDRGAARSEDISNKAVRIPILGRVAAGIPIEQIVDIDGWEEISDELAKNGKYFALKIHGNSMEPRMCEKDTIIVRQQNSVENGEIAVVSINGLDATCKKIEYTDDGISLISFNPAYAPMKFTKEQAEQLPITILGKVIELRAKM